MADNVIDYIPLAGVVVGSLVVWLAARAVIRRKARRDPHANVALRNQVATIAVVFVGLVAAIVAMPISDSQRGQILALLGIVLSAAIALSATTILGNLIAGMMLRSVRGFRTGDFIRCDSHFGRVSARGLFHTEVQTEDRDLTTLPNMFLVTHPVTTIRTSGTVLSTSVGLGYDVPRHDVEEVLLAAAERAGLEQGFVQITELGDFAVVYRCAGLLTDVKRLITVRSNLNGAVLDGCHEAGIEIVSPAFMNQRQVNGVEFIPRRHFRARADHEVAHEDLPEAMLFDKAEQAESREILLATLAKIEQLIDDSAGEVHPTLLRRRDLARSLLADIDGDEDENDGADTPKSTST
ncbi:MAG: mechanosensitive ion channel [Ilumatobacter sp.]|uniref:mechanosensitive ion channel family protein n=1 Tax=Ilumatobacter sp. TaxID=1967498 RepID=UPI0026302B69|nr:mechanosensitive ion channel domain-containing protein [Ilumatobacter sp.]MDJ0767150.1 mechanosensitive ion channel [Ilumatobacter sp.]